jgi:hypothetical protein
MVLLWNEKRTENGRSARSRRRSDLASAWAGEAPADRFPVHHVPEQHGRRTIRVGAFRVKSRRDAVPESNLVLEEVHFPEPRTVLRRLPLSGYSTTSGVVLAAATTKRAGDSPSFRT